jgi:hypothetical protein
MDPMTQCLSGMSMVPTALYSAHFPTTVPVQLPPYQTVLQGHQNSAQTLKPESVSDMLAVTNAGATLKFKVPMLLVAVH